MFERFTEDARSVVERAMASASVPTSGGAAPQVGPAELFRALLEDRSCRAVAVLEGLGAPADRLLPSPTQGDGGLPAGLDHEDAVALSTIGIDLEEVLRRFGPLDAEVPAGPGRRRRPRFSRAAKTVLELSLREAVALRHHGLGTEHLLLGLARQGDVVVVGALAAYDLDLTVLRAAVEDAGRRAG